MNIKTFSGSYYEIGFRRGRELDDLPMPEVNARDVAFALACRGCVGDLFPPLLDTFEGMLAGGGFDRDRFTVYFFARKHGLLRGCTAFAALPEITRDGAVIVGRNYDWGYSDLRWCELHYRHPDGSWPILSFTHHWAGHPDCLNREGLCVLISSLPAQDPEEPGVQWNLVVDSIAATCCRTGEARRILESVYHLRSMAYLVVDATGDAIVAEAVPGSVRIRHPRSGSIIATNHALGNEDGSVRTHRSKARYDRVGEVVRARAGGVMESLAQDILSDHCAGICCGPHGARAPGPEDGGFGTLWSPVCRPDRLRLLIAEGHPCEVVYERVSFDDVEAEAA